MLPFLAGLAVGSALTILYAKREDVKKAINSPAFKDKVKETKRLSQQALSDVKDKMNSLLTNFKGENPTQKSKKATNSKSKSAETKTPSKRGRKKKSPTSESVAVPKTTATRSRAVKTTTKKSTAKKSTRAERTKKASPSTTTTPTSEIAEAN